MLEDAPVLPSGRRSTPGMLGVVMSVLLSGRRYDRIHQSGSLPRRPTRWTPLERIHQSGSLPRRPTRWTPLERLHQSGSLPSCLTRWTLLERIHQSGFFPEASFRMDATRPKSVLQSGRCFERTHQSGSLSRKRLTRWTQPIRYPPMRASYEMDAIPDLPLALAVPDAARAEQRRRRR